MILANIGAYRQPYNFTRRVIVVYAPYQVVTHAIGFDVFYFNYPFRQIFARNSVIVWNKQVQVSFFGGNGPALAV